MSHCLSLTTPATTPSLDPSRETSHCQSDLLIGRYLVFEEHLLYLSSTFQGPHPFSVHAHYLSSFNDTDLTQPPYSLFLFGLSVRPRCNSSRGTGTILKLKLGFLPPSDTCRLRHLTYSVKYKRPMTPSLPNLPCSNLFLSGQYSDNSLPLCIGTQGCLVNRSVDPVE